MSYKVQGSAQVQKQPSLPTRKFSPPDSYLRRLPPKSPPSLTPNNTQTAFSRDQVEKVQAVTINGVFNTMSRFFQNEVGRHPHFIVKIKKWKHTNRGTMKAEFSKRKIKAQNRFLKKNLLADMKALHEAGRFHEKNLIVESI